MTERQLLVVGLHWRSRQTELTFLTRSIAAAATRWASVTVLTRGVRDQRDPDGAFDLEGIGEEDSDLWPTIQSPDCPVVVDDPVPEIVTYLSTLDARSVFYLAAAELTGLTPWQRLSVVPSSPGAPHLGLYVPVNLLALQHRHNGFGFVGYTLVLSGARGLRQDPPPAAAWLTSGLPEEYVVVVENGVASAWKGRALRGTVTVDTRMDLWRLMAHALCVHRSRPGSLPRS